MSIDQTARHKSFERNSRIHMSGRRRGWAPEDRAGNRNSNPIGLGGKQSVSHEPGFVLSQGGQGQRQAGEDKKNDESTSNDPRHLYFLSCLVGGQTAEAVCSRRWNGQTFGG